MTSPIWRVRLMVGRRVMTPKMNGSIPLPATMGRMSPYSIRKEAHSMKKFLRLTSVFLCCALLSSFLFAPASATYTDPDLPGYTIYNLKDFSGEYSVVNGDSFSFAVGSSPLKFIFPFTGLTSSTFTKRSSLYFFSSDNFKSGSSFSCSFNFPDCSTSVSSKSSYSWDFYVYGLPLTNSGNSYSAFKVRYVPSASYSVTYTNGDSESYAKFDPIFSGDPSVEVVKNSSGVPTGISFSGTLCTDLLSGDTSLSVFPYNRISSIDLEFSFYSSPPTVDHGSGYLIFSSFNDLRFVAPSGDNPGGGGDNPGGGGYNPGGGDTPGGDTSGLATLAEQLTQSVLLAGIKTLLSDVYKVCDENRSYTYACNMQLHDKVVPFLRSIMNSAESINQLLSNQQDAEIVASQKENVEQVKDDFLTGQSGKTSLGKGDFKSLSSVGGTFKDTISLNGQSSITDLTSGLSDADSVGQGWFSQATKDCLDAVSGSGSSVSVASIFSVDSSEPVYDYPDPYHMQGFENNYAWLWGDD